MPVIEDVGNLLRPGAGADQGTIGRGEIVVVRAAVVVADPQVQQILAFVQVDRQEGQAAGERAFARTGAEGKGSNGLLADPRKGKAGGRLIVPVRIEEHDSGDILERLKKGVMAVGPFHVVLATGAGRMLQTDRLLEMADKHVLDNGHVFERHVEVVQADAADVGRGFLVGHILDVGKVHLRDEIDVLADRTVSPQPRPAHVRTVLQRERQGLASAAVPGVVEFETAADVEPECLVGAFQHGAVVPEGVQPRSLVGNGRFHRGRGPRGRLVAGRVWRRLAVAGHSGPRRGHQAARWARGLPATGWPLGLPARTRFAETPHCGRRSGDREQNDRNAGNRQCAHEVQDLPLS